MGPRNDHEAVIALIVDKFDVDGRLSTRAIEDVIAVLDFSMSKIDTEFLVNYIRWRMGNPIWKTDG
ncbi:MAG TPA: hypothetical protein VGR71_05965 [Nitrospira sp.]|nr:hypothetical protein [Nitrospira sp.]